MRRFFETDDSPEHPLSVKSSIAGFSVVELLTVISLISILTVLVVPSVSGIRSGAAVGEAVYSVRDAVDRARQQARSRNTWVCLGFFEEDGGKEERGTAGKGRVILGMLASKNGLQSDFSSTDGTNSLEAIERPVRLNNVALSDGDGAGFSGAPAEDAALDLVPSDVGGEQLSFAMSGTTYNFKPLIQINPRGEATMGVGSGSLPRYIRIGLVPAKGSTALKDDPNVALLLVSGPGAVAQIYRP